MKIEDFKVVNDEKYIESCNKIIEDKCCKNVLSCFTCPFDFKNLTNENHDCTEYSDVNDCVLQDDKLVQSAEQFLELVELQKRVESTTAKSVIDESKYKAMNPTSFVEKEEEDIILDQNNCICSEVNTLKLAEEFVSLSLQKDSDNIFTIYKKVKVGKAKVNVETEWCE